MTQESTGAVVNTAHVLVNTAHVQALVQDEVAHYLRQLGSPLADDHGSLTERTVLVLQRQLERDRRLAAPVEDRGEAMRMDAATAAEAGRNAGALQARQWSEALDELLVTLDSSVSLFRTTARGQLHASLEKPAVSLVEAIRSAQQHGCLGEPLSALLDGEERAAFDEGRAQAWRPYARAMPVLANQLSSALSALEARPDARARSVALTLRRNVEDTERELRSALQSDRVRSDRATSSERAQISPPTREEQRHHAARRQALQVRTEVLRDRLEDVPWLRELAELHDARELEGTGTARSLVESADAAITERLAAERTHRDLIDSPLLLGIERADYDRAHWARMDNITLPPAHRFVSASTPLLAEYLFAPSDVYVELG